MLDWWRSRAKRKEESEAAMSREIARRIAEKAQRLQESLQAYHQHENPFAAMCADVYNRDQLSRIYKNGSGS